LSVFRLMNIGLMPPYGFGLIQQSVPY
jgi:hypothetical protein